MTSEYTHRNQSYQDRFVDAETSPFKNSRKEIKTLANPIYKHALQYFDTPVKNSSLYPNLWHIKPVDYEYRPSDIGRQIDKSIHDNKNYVFGPYIMQHRAYNPKA
jgi:hypothetical protein